MPNELEVFAFQFQGRAETKETTDNQGKVTSPADAQVVSVLNQKSDEITQEIQQQIGRLLPPSITVRAEVRFYLENSFFLDGMVLLSSWVAPIMLRVGQKVLTGGEKTLTDQLSHLVKVGLQKAFQRFLAGDKKPAELTTATIDLPQLNVTAESHAEPANQSESISQSQSTPTGQSAGGLQSSNTQGQQPTTLQIASPLRVEVIQPQPNIPADQTTRSLLSLTTRNLVLITAASTALLTLVFVIFVIMVLNLAMRPSGESLPKQSPKAEPKSSTLLQKLEEGPDGFAIRGTRVLAIEPAYIQELKAWSSFIHLTHRQASYHMSLLTECLLYPLKNLSLPRIFFRVTEKHATFG
jgi:hypothetical protein